jgi:flagellin-like hook-associated protein FlgL
MATYITVSMDDVSGYIQNQTGGVSLQQIADNVLALQSVYGTVTSMLSDISNNINTLQANMAQAQSDIADLATRVSQLEDL